MTLRAKIMQAAQQLETLAQTEPDHYAEIFISCACIIKQLAARIPAERPTLTVVEK